MYAKKPEMDHHLGPVEVDYWFSRLRIRQLFNAGNLLIDRELELEFFLVAGEQ
ncbi:MAG: hypothetical protein JWN70_4706 [Planctomycetaceae bacterium]|nr:hypothetical protein [Planctomycetaceae bacterium]